MYGLYGASHWRGRAKVFGVVQRGTLSKRSSTWKENQNVDQFQVRVLCASEQWVGERGSILGVTQLNDIEARHHSLELLFEFPVPLDVEQTDAFQFASHNIPSFINN